MMNPDSINDIYIETFPLDGKQMENSSFMHLSKKTSTPVQLQQE